MKKQTGPTLPVLQKRFDAFKKALPAKVANKARNFFVDSFRRQGFLGSSGLEAWPARKAADNGKSRGILVQTGALRRSMMATHTINTAKVAVVGPAKRYAGIHNNGGEVKNKGGQPYMVLPANKVSTGIRRRFPRKGDKVIVFLKKRPSYGKNVRFTKPFTFTMPKRQFIGNSTVLDRQLLVMANKDLRKIINP